MEHSEIARCPKCYDVHIMGMPCPRLSEAVSSAGSPVTLEIEWGLVREIVDSLKNAEESARELLLQHQEELGETTRKNKSYAGTLRHEASEAKRLWAYLVGKWPMLENAALSDRRGHSQ